MHYPPETEFLNKKYKHMKTRIPMVLFLILFLNNIFSQNINQVIKIEYDFNLNLGRNQHFNATLFVRQNEQLFKWNNTEEDFVIEQEENSNDLSISTYKSDSIGSYNYTNLSKDSITSRLIWFSNKLYYIKESKTKINWKVLDETKKIGEFTCQKAIAEFRGRIYSAWFTNELPFNASPWKLHGLPGVVLKVSDEDNKIQFEFKSISILDNSDIFIFQDENAETLTLDQFIKLQNSMADDLEKKIMSKLPRGSKIETSKSETMEIFDQK